MRPRVAWSLLGALLALAAVGVGAAPARTRPCHPRRHHPCPKPHKPLPRRLEVDENDQGQPPRPYSLIASHNPVGAGVVQFNVYNFGEDSHTFAILDARRHRRALVDAPANQPDTAVPVRATLPRGTYTLECTLSGHARLGMRATLTVR